MQLRKQQIMKYFRKIILDALSISSLEIRKLLLVSKQTLKKKINERKELMKKNTPNIMGYI